MYQCCLSWLPWLVMFTRVLHLMDLMFCCWSHFNFKWSLYIISSLKCIRQLVVGSAGRYAVLLDLTFVVLVNLIMTLVNTLWLECMVRRKIIVLLDLTGAV